MNWNDPQKGQGTAYRYFTSGRVASSRENPSPSSLGVENHMILWVWGNAFVRILDSVNGSASFPENAGYFPGSSPKKYSTDSDAMTDGDVAHPSMRSAPWRNETERVEVSVFRVDSFSATRRQARMVGTICRRLIRRAVFSSAIRYIIGPGVWSMAYSLQLTAAWVLPVWGAKHIKISRT